MRAGGRGFLFVRHDGVGEGGAMSQRDMSYICGLIGQVQVRKEPRRGQPCGDLTVEQSR